MVAFKSMQALLNFMSRLLVPQSLSVVDEVKWDYHNGPFWPWKPKPVLEGFDSLQSWLEHAEEGRCGNLCPAAPSPLLLWSLFKSQSRNKWRIPVVPPSSSKTTRKRQSPGQRCLGMATGLCSSSRSSSIVVPGKQEPQESWDEGTRHLGQPAPCILPHGLCRDRASQGMLGFCSLGGRKVVHIIFTRLQAKSYSFYLQKLFQSID